MSAAEEVCIKQGGHLASVSSQEEQEELTGLIGLDYSNLNDVYHWLGGKKEKGSGEWHWLNGQQWRYENWAPVSGEPKYGLDCVTLGKISSPL